MALLDKWACAYWSWHKEWCFFSRVGWSLATIFLETYNDDSLNPFLQSIPAFGYLSPSYSRHEEHLINIFFCVCLLYCWCLFYWSPFSKLNWAPSLSYRSHFLELLLLFFSALSDSCIPWTVMLKAEECFLSDLVNFELQRRNSVCVSKVILCFFPFFSSFLFLKQFDICFSLFSDPLKTPNPFCRGAA